MKDIKPVKDSEGNWIDILSGKELVPVGEKKKKPICNVKLYKEGIILTYKEIPKLPEKGISISYTNEDKKKAIWDFTPYELMEMIDGLSEGLSDRVLCVRLCAPRDVIKKLRYKLTGGLMKKIEKELGGKKKKNEKSRNPIRVTARKRINHVAGIRCISGNK